jgi:hypothetical protein
MYVFFVFSVENDLIYKNLKISEISWFCFEYINFKNLLHLQKINIKFNLISIACNCTIS